MALTLTLQSGDRAALDGVVAEIRRVAERKGVELKGPHTEPPDRIRVPLFRGADGSGGRFPAWNYTVYERVVRLAGHDEAVRQVADIDLPRGVHLEIALEQPGRGHE